MSRLAQGSTPYILLGTEARARLLQALDAAARRWLSVWRARPGAPCVARLCNDRPSRVFDGCSEQYRVSAGTDMLDVAIPATALGEIADLPLRRFLTAAPLTRAQSLAGQLHATVGRSLAEEVMDSASIETWQFERRDVATAGSDRIVRAQTAVLVVGEREVAALDLSAQLIEALVPRRTAAAGSPLESRGSAIGDARVVVEAVLGSVEVPLASLATLECGDVLMMSAPIDGQCTLEVPGVGIVGSAALGRHRGRRAVEVHQLNDKGN